MTNKQIKVICIRCKKLIGYSNKKLGVLCPICMLDYNILRVR